MNIVNAEWSAGKLVLTTSDADAVRFAYRFEAGEYEIVKAKKKRSLDANAYAWVLINKIAEALRISPAEVYRNAIKDVAGNSEIVCVQDRAVEKLVQGWHHNGLGWQTEILPSKIRGCTNVVLYYGSSSYDSHQMSLLIDKLKQDAEALGIETLTPEQLDKMLTEWV